MRHGSSLSCFVSDGSVVSFVPRNVEAFIIGIFRAYHLLRVAWSAEKSML